MITVTIKETKSPSIIKFELSDFITNTDNFEFKNIDEATDSPLAQQLFYLPFVKTVYISGNFIAVEKYNIVTWTDVKEAVAEQIENFVNKSGQIITRKDNIIKKLPVSVYVESTPNPSVLKFVASKILTKTTVIFNNTDETKVSPLAKELFKFPFVKEIFIDQNYIAITKHDISEWSEITPKIRSFIKQYVEEGKTIIDEILIVDTPQYKEQQEKKFDNLDILSQQIINILEEYVKPAVTADGGNILFDSYYEKEKIVKVILQGACNGCPSSTFTLKNGIESMLRELLNDSEIKVEAI